MIQIISIQTRPRNVFLNIAINKADKTNGNTEYPRTQMDWKKLIVPPSNFAFNVTTAEPIHILQNTAAKTEEACLDGARMARRMDRDKHTMRGPLL